MQAIDEKRARDYASQLIKHYGVDHEDDIDLPDSESPLIDVGVLMLEHIVADQTADRKSRLQAAYYQYTLSERDKEWYNYEAWPDEVFRVLVPYFPVYERLLRTQGWSWGAALIMIEIMDECGVRKLHNEPS